MASAERRRVAEHPGAPGPGEPARLAQVLLDCVVAITSPLGVRVVLSRLLAAAREVSGADDATLTIVGRDGAVIEVVGVDDGHDDPGSVRVPVLVRGTAVGSIHLTSRSGQRVFTEAELVSVNAVANAVGFVIDGARSQGRDELRRRWLEGSAWLSEALRPPIDSQLALQRITEVARSISGATATAFIQWPPDLPPTITMVEGREQEAFEVLLERLTSGPRLSSAPDDVLHVVVDGRRAIVLPLRAQIAVPAALVAFFDVDGDLPVDAEESGLLESLAGHASLALDRVQAAADRIDLEDVSRRDRVARELHDVVIQRLFATGLQLEGMRTGLTDAASMERIDLAIEDIDVTIRHIREAIFAVDRAGAGVS